MRRGWIANLFTLGNLAAGVAGPLLAVEGRVEIAAIAILVAAVLDGLDGRIARLLGTTSELGAELDSLSDVVSFGVAPAVLAYLVGLHSWGIAGAAVAIAYSASAAYRLARFNLGTPSGFFAGLPSTAAGAGVALLVLRGVDTASPLVPGSLLAFAVLMVSTLPYPDFKHVSLRELRSSKVFLAVAASGVVAFIDPAKLLILPLAVYFLYGPKDGPIAGWTALRLRAGARG